MALITSCIDNLLKSTYSLFKEQTFLKKLIILLDRLDKEKQTYKETNPKHFILIHYFKTEIQLPGQFSSELKSMISPQTPMFSPALEFLVFYSCWSTEVVVVRPFRKEKIVSWQLSKAQAGYEIQFCFNPNRDLLVVSVNLGLIP